MILVVGIVLTGVFLLVVVGRPRSYGIARSPFRGARGEGRTYRSEPRGPVWDTPKKPFTGASSTWSSQPSHSYGGHKYGGGGMKYGGGKKYGGGGKKYGGGAKSKW